MEQAARTLRLLKVGQQTLYFADRPERIAGHVKMGDYLTEWTSKAGPDNFHNNPPNAALSVFEPSKAKDTLAVVEISNPKIEGADLVYNLSSSRALCPPVAGRRHSLSTGSAPAAAPDLVSTA